MAFEAVAPSREEPVWRLADLAERRAFDRYVGMVATAIADRFAVAVHIDGAGRWRAYNGWIARLQNGPDSAINDYRFAATCAELIECLAGHRVVTYAAGERDVSDPMTDVVLRYPNEVTALAAGAALYIVRAAALNGDEIAEPLAPAVAENAAAALQRQPAGAAERFRELLRLATPST